MMDVDVALAELGALAQDEYGCGLMKSLAVDNALAAKRIARLTGIMIKMPFADPVVVSQPTWETGANREWHYNHSKMMALLPTNSAWEVPLGVFHENVARGESLEHLVAHLSSESNWFLALLNAVQPVLCSDKGFAEALNVQVDDWIDKGAEAVVLRLGGLIATLVPWLSGHDRILVGLSLYIGHYAKKDFCKGTFNYPEVTTLGPL